MPGISNFFTHYCEALVKKLTEEQYENFNDGKNDENRIKMLYPHCADMTIPPVTYGKSYDDALSRKNIGNNHFGKHENTDALECYNTAIIKCPQTAEESRKLLAVLVANRSACLFELQEYEKALADIEYVTLTGDYPDESKYKLSTRKGKCLSKTINGRHLASDAYEVAMKDLNASKLAKNVIAAKKQEILDALEELKSIIPPQTSVAKSDIQSFYGNANYPNASKAVAFDSQENLGRYAIATENIKSGAIIINESPHCAVLAEEFQLTNCQCCMLATNTPLPCPNCANIVYCSQKCQNSTIFHKLECGLHPALFSSGASINCYMALRMIIQHPVGYFEELFKQLPSKATIHHDSQNYMCVFSLCAHEDKRKKEEFFHYTVMAIFLLRLLKLSDYFECTSGMKVTQETEFFIGSLILRNLQIVQFNAHEVSELQEAPPGPLDPQDEPNFKAIYIGGGIYPTLALFNHSCDPSIIRYNIGTRMIVKAIKPIKKGQIIYENYGPIYTNSPREERKRFLSDRYWFDCQCQACIENWPLFKEMKESEVKISCANQKCNNFFYLHDTLTSFVYRCKRCQTSTSLFLPLKALSKLETILPQAEEFYKSRNYNEATKLYLNAITTYDQHTVPPHPDWVKVQQRLRTCMVSAGNKSIKYTKIRGDK